MTSLVSRLNNCRRAFLRSTMAVAAAAASGGGGGGGNCRTSCQVQEKQRRAYTTQRRISRSGRSSFCVRKEKVVCIVGATGTGKTKLSIDAAVALGGEVVNADKIQLYAGLDITTNKVATDDRRGIPHHLLGCVLPAAGELPASTFRSLAAANIATIAARRRVPVVAGGSNSLIHALLADRYDPAAGDPFAEGGCGRWRPKLRYRCCLLWVDVEPALLREYLDRRVDDMVDGGMVEELREYFARTPERERARHVGLGKAIGVPELGEHFSGRRHLGEAVEEIKANTRVLAATQVGKIRRMAQAWGWPLRRLDATAAVRARLDGAGKDAETDAWERDVRGPGMDEIERFLVQEESDNNGDGYGDDDEERYGELQLLRTPSVAF